MKIRKILSNFYLEIIERAIPMNDKIYNPFQLYPFYPIYPFYNRVQILILPQRLVQLYYRMYFVCLSIHRGTNTKGSFIQTNKILPRKEAREIKGREDRGGRFLSSFPSILASSRPDAPILAVIQSAQPFPFYQFLPPRDLRVFPSPSTT